jgi:Resolvase, N terminal domain
MLSGRTNPAALNCPTALVHHLNAATLCERAVAASGWTQCLAFMREGVVLTVTKPDRLARSTAELLSIEADLSKPTCRSAASAQRRPAPFCPISL